MSYYIPKDGYKKSGRSYTEKMSDAEIISDLGKYKEVKDISSVELTRHMRYFVWDPKKGGYRYRKGGFLMKKDDPRYVVLSQSPYPQNKHLPRWSVQRSIGGHDTIFYRLMQEDEYEKEEVKSESGKITSKYQKALKEKQLENEKLRAMLSHYMSNGTK